MSEYGLTSMTPSISCVMSHSTCLHIKFYFVRVFLPIFSQCRDLNVCAEFAGLIDRRIWQIPWLSMNTMFLLDVCSENLAA